MKAVESASDSAAPGASAHAARVRVTAAAAAGAMTAAPVSARAAPLPSALGRDATHFGVRPNSPDDQTRALQRAIDDAADNIVRSMVSPEGLLYLQTSLGKLLVWGKAED